MFLNELEVVDRGLGIAPFEPESRHVRMNGAQAVLQSFAEIIVVKLVIAKHPKRRCIEVRALARRAHGVTPSALGLEQGFSALLSRPIYAALTSERKRLTCPASSLDCEDSCSAAPST